MALAGLLIVVAFIGSLCTANICHEEYEINNETKCERDYNIERHELVGLLKTVEEVTYLCRTYPKYETCLKGLISGCPRYQSFLDLKLYDEESTNIAFKGFCDDRVVYLKAIPCLVPSFPNIIKCFGGHSSGLERAQGVLRATNDWDQFYDTACPIQTEGANCIAAAFGNCSADARKMMKNIAFSLIHSRCKDAKYKWFQSDYDSKYGSSAAQVTFSSLSVLLLIALSVRLM